MIELGKKKETGQNRSPSHSVKHYLVAVLLSAVTSSDDHRRRRHVRHRHASGVLR